MLILRPGELQIRPNGDIFARTDSPERSVTFLISHIAGGRREESRLYSVDGQEIRLDGWGWLIFNEKAH